MRYPMSLDSFASSMTQGRLSGILKEKVNYNFI